MEMKIEAVDKGRGMTTTEVMDAIVRARSAGCPRLVKTRVGFKGQIQSLAFGPDPLPDPFGPNDEERVNY